jgi:hypothetical protein
VVPPIPDTDDLSRGQLHYSDQLARQPSEVVISEVMIEVIHVPVEAERKEGR